MPEPESAATQTDASTDQCCTEPERYWEPCGPDCDAYDTTSTG